MSAILKTSFESGWKEAEIKEILIKDGYRGGLMKSVHMYLPRHLDFAKVNQPIQEMR